MNKYNGSNAPGHEVRQQQQEHKAADEFAEHIRHKQTVSALL